MLKNLLVIGSAAICFCFPIHLHGQEPIAAGYPNITSASELIEKWTPNQHLYVKGQLGIGPQQLERLEDWLDEHGPHWTVVLMRNADGETYRSLDGRNFRGMDAVEHALGRGLALRTNFSEWVDARTGETDGAVFVLFLEERQFSYYASVAHDTRSLGESNWVGKLDRPAYRAMSGGGRILDAVRDTVTEINSRLDARITTEREQADLEQRARQRAYLNLVNDIGSLRTSIQQAQEFAGQLTTAYPAAKGDLTDPPVEQWNGTLTTIEDGLTPDNVAASTDSYNAISPEVESFLNEYSEHQTFDQRVAPIEQAIRELQASTHSAGLPAAEEAKEQLEQGRQIRDDGQLGLSQYLDNAEAAIARGRRANVEAQRNIEQAQARQDLIRKTVVSTCIVVVLIVLLILVWLNRRRRPAMQRAQSTFAEKRKQVKTELDGVYRLFERSNEVLGDKKRLERRGFAGLTKKLAGNALEDVDDLIVMSSEVERVMSEAESMIHPERVLARVTGLFSTAVYERGINHFSGTPLKFSKHQGLPLVIQRESERTGDVLADEVTMTFDQVFAAFHDRMATAEKTIDTVESSLIHLEDGLEALQDQLNSTIALEQQLTNASDDDGLLELPSFFEKLIPSAQADLDQAERTSASDPVRAIQEIIPRGARKLTDAAGVGLVVQQARAQVFPQLNEYAPQLGELGYATDWIQRSVSELGERADGLLQEAVDENVSAEIDALAQDAASLGGRASEVLSLAVKLKQQDAASIEQFAAEIDAARNQISAALQLPAEACLAEPQWLPASNLEQARSLLEATRASLQQGGLKAAEDTHQHLRQQIAQGRSLVEQSLAVLTQFDGSMREQKRRHMLVAEKVSEHEQLVQRAQSEFLSSALLLHPGDGESGDSAATITTHLAAVHEALAEVTELAEQASNSYHKGQLIAAAELLDSARALSEDADQKLQQIGRHCSNVHDQVRTNLSELTATLQDAKSLASKTFDRRTMRPTIDRYQQVVQQLEALQRRHSASTGQSDPFADAATISEYRTALDEIRGMLQADHAAFDEAARAVDGAKQERRAGERLIHRARGDQIPDSPGTTASISSIEQFDTDLTQLEHDLRSNHHDWNRLTQSAARLQRELGTEAGRLRGELVKAEEMAHLLQAASDTVVQANRWSGGFGTRIFGSPGSAELQQARQALSRGDYVALAELARAAQTAAQLAIQSAQRQVRRQQREAARRAEQARRRRRKSISMGGGSTGFGSSSSRASTRHTSSRSSGSGFSRSGW